MHRRGACVNNVSPEVLVNSYYIRFMKFIIALLLLISAKADAQEFIPLWPKGKMPNTKGLQLKDSIVNERA